MAGERALITGILGFGGTHLGDHLRRQGYAVSGIDLSSANPASDVVVYGGDIRDPSFLHYVIGNVRPTHIFHLAARIAPDEELELLYDVNVRGTDSLLTVVRSLGLDPVILITGSSAAYGVVKADELPIRESQPFRPASYYAVTKIAQEMVAYAHHAQHGLRVIRTRAFNVTGPGEPPNLVCAAFARQIAEIEAGQSQPVLRTGNLSPQRDFVDVRDLVRAYQLVAEQGEPGEVYNVCSGRAVSIQACLQELVKLAHTPIQVSQDPARVRATDLAVSVGDPSRLYRKTGWQARISLEQSLADLLTDWRLRVACPGGPSRGAHGQYRDGVEGS